MDTKSLNTYSVPVVKVISAKARNLICTSPSEGQPQGMATNEGYTEDQFVW